MINLDRAKKELENNYITLALCKGNELYTSNRRGVIPMLSYIKDNTYLSGFSAADKVVGKAVALLFVKAKIKEVFANVISESAVQVFKENKINYSYNTLVEYIKNRSGTEICTIETAVENINNPDEAIAIINNELSNESKTFDK